MNRGYIRQSGRSFEVRLPDGCHPDGSRRIITRMVSSIDVAVELLTGLGGDPSPPQRDGPARRQGWPLQELLEATGLTSPEAVERAAGLTSGIGRRWATHGLTDEAADRVAIGLGLHPACIWGDWC